MKLQMKRWHFDVSALTGLILFSISYYLLEPRPTVRFLIDKGYRQHSEVHTLDFSPDGNSFYTIENVFTPSETFRPPLLKSWDLQIGCLKAEYPLLIPAEDIARFQNRQSNKIHSIPGQIQPSGVLTLTLKSREKSGVQNLQRLYDVATGNPASEYMVTDEESILYLGKHPVTQHHLACLLTANEKKQPIRVVDLTVASLLATIPFETERSFQNLQFSQDNQFLIVLWYPQQVDQANKVKHDIAATWYDVNSWKPVCHLVLPEARAILYQLVELSAKHWVVRYGIVGNSTYTICHIRMDA